ncbi:hypothetical protein PISMIDRAFT_36601, partial [Pisolithus microcarpus 441]
DTHNHRDCINFHFDQWNVQMPLLVAAYLDYCSHDAGEGFPSADDLTAANEIPVQLPPGSVSDIELIDVFSKLLIFPGCVLLLLFPYKHLPLSNKPTGHVHGSPFKHNAKCCVTSIV